jgi:hypothetical protein
MSNPQDKHQELVRIDLTVEQKAQIKQLTGKDAESIELKADELEERLTPRSGFIM